MIYVWTTSQWCLLWTRTSIYYHRHTNWRMVAVNSPKFKPNQNLPLKYLARRVEMIRQFITAKSFVEFTFAKILPLQYFATYGIMFHSTCKEIWLHMWPDLPKGVLYTHSFRSHFSLSFNRYNNRPTVHACTIAESSAVCFYWGLIRGPVWRPRMLGWSVNGLSLPGQADRRQGITTGLAGETGHQCSYILRRVELKTVWIEAIWP